MKRSVRVALAGSGVAFLLVAWTFCLLAIFEGDGSAYGQALIYVAGTTGLVGVLLLLGSTVPS